ncbi:hypothetical protein MKW92_002083 [Papaver armeniacum]|nr:hypothetical protein MKW92_002083 [Papaver armeniacum]
MAEDEDTSNPKGLIIVNNEIIKSFLTSAKSDQNLTHELRQISSKLLSQRSIPYKSLRQIWSKSLPSTRPNLHHLFSGSNFERLKKLSDLAERREYKELVKDITPAEQTDEPVTMFTGYLVGYAAFRALFNRNPVMNAAGGILGLVFAMLLETLLFIIKTSSKAPGSSSAAASKLKKRQ